MHPRVVVPPLHRASSSAALAIVIGDGVLLEVKSAGRAGSNRPSSVALIDVISTVSQERKAIAVQLHLAWCHQRTDPSTLTTSHVDHETTHAQPPTNVAWRGRISFVTPTWLHEPLRWRSSSPPMTWIAEATMETVASGWLHAPRPSSSLAIRSTRRTDPGRPVRTSRSNSLESSGSPCTQGPHCPALCAAK